MADPKEEEILRWLRFAVTESAAATYTEVSIATNLSLERGVIWDIHMIEFGISPTDLNNPAAGAREEVIMQITRESKSALVEMNDSDLIAMCEMVIDRSAAIGTDAGPLYVYFPSPIRQKFHPPILYGAENIYVGLKTLNGAATTIRGRLGYTLRSVSEKVFYRVAQALVN